MKKHLSILLLIAFFLTTTSIVIAQKPTAMLKGKVMDASTGAVLEGASIYFPDLKKGTVTNAQGAYQIQLELGNHMVEVSYIGYAIYSKNIPLTTTQEQDFALSHTAVESSNVTVTSFLRATSAKRTPTPISIIKKDDLFKSSATNFVDALSKTPGVTQLSTGPAISKPIIRGLGYNRVVVLNDGVRQEGQQWGDEHGIEIDEYNVSRIEVLKVPASIIYGSEALSGVINVISNVPVPQGAVRGNVYANYQSNNGLQGYHFDMAGNNNGWVWGLNGTSKRAHDYQNKYDGYVYNSKYNELNGSIYTGIEKEWGYSHLFVSQFTQNIGMIEGERDENGAFLKPANYFPWMSMLVPEAIPVNTSDFKSTTPAIPYQNVQHTKYTWDNNIQWGAGRLKVNLAYQRNQRKEFGNVEDPTEKSLYFDLGTLNYSLQYLLAEKNNWKHTIGVNGMHQENKNKGIEVLIPEYKTVDLGLFFYTQKNINSLHLSGGLRIDKKGIEFNDQKKEYGALAGSFGMTYEVGEDWVLKFNVAKGYRAPNLAELGSNGAHEGTNRFEYGNTQLKSEKSVQVDLGAEWATEHISITGNVFYNKITDYIFYQKLVSVAGGDSLIVDAADGSQLYAFAYQQQNAKLYGGEFNIDIHPHPFDGLHIENTLSYLRGSFDNEIDGSKNLPMIPSLRYLSEIRYEWESAKGKLQNSYVSVQLENVAAQNNPFTGFNTETKTPGYSLLNIGLGTQVMKKGKQLFGLSLTAQNITDVAYQHHLSRLKYTSENPLTGRVGVYNMGRNFSLKLNVPLVFD